MEHLGAPPVDARSSGERLEKFELRRSRGNQDAGLAAFGYRLFDCSRGVRRRCLTELPFVAEDERADIDASLEHTLGECTFSLLPFPFYLSYWVCRTNMP